MRPRAQDTEENGWSPRKISGHCWNGTQPFVYELTVLAVMPPSTTSIRNDINVRSIGIQYSVKKYSQLQTASSCSVAAQ